jgi:hypothetical protein
MVQRLVPALSRSDSYLEVILNLILPDKVIKAPRAKATVKTGVLSPGFTRYNALYFNPL